MSVKSSTVMARVEPEIKERAEGILESLGVSASGVINMLYRQIIIQNGIPFSISLSRSIKNADDMSEAEMNTMLEKGLSQAKAGRGVSLDEAFHDLEGSIG